MRDAPLVSQDERERAFAQILWIRVLAALLIVSTTAIARLAGMVRWDNLDGVALSCVFIIVTGGAAHALRRRIGQGRGALAFSVVDRLFTVAGFTGVIYFLGGIEATYLCPLYVALTLYAGIVSLWRLPFTIAFLSTVFFAATVVLQHAGVLPSFAVYRGFTIPWDNQVAILCVTGVLLIASAYVASRASRIINEGRALLSAQNAELAAAKDRAQESDRLKSEFVANMSHELRTPLNHVIGFTDLVLDQAGDGLDAEHREYLDHVRQSGRHLLSLLDDVLDMARVESGRVELAFGDVRPAELLESSLTFVRDAAERGGITLHSDIEGLPTACRVDARRVTQVLINLLTNAIKFTPHGGSVTLRARPCMEESFPSGAGLEISVSDTGIGLSSGDLERIFAPFERAPGALALPGTGLGLALSRRFVELHGGRIWAESKGEKRGATFRVRLPLLSPGSR